MKPVVIGVAGKSGAGKDAIARHLVAHHGFRVIRFADALKEEVLNKLRLTSTEIWKANQETVLGGYDGSEPSEGDLRRLIWDDKPPIMRRLLQEMGTEVRRADDQSYWTKKWSAEVRRAIDQGVSVVAPDTRFPNEVASLADVGGYFARVVRPGAGEGAAGHVSETAIDDEVADWTFHNTQDFNHLFQAVDDYLDYISRAK